MDRAGQDAEPDGGIVLYELLGARAITTDDKPDELVLDEVAELMERPGADDDPAAAECRQVADVLTDALCSSSGASSRNARPAGRGRSRSRARS